MKKNKHIQRLKWMCRKIFGKQIVFQNNILIKKKLIIKNIHGYKITNRIGNVYLAKSKEKKFIVKFLNPFTKYTNTEIDSLINNEIKIINTIRKIKSDYPKILSGIFIKNILTLKGINKIFIYYKILEYIEGESLRNILAINLVSYNDKINIAISICKELLLLHNLNIIHGDVKPENIIVLENKEILFIDFEFSIYSNGSVNETHAFTPAYASPEQRLLKYPVTNKTDIYSLGIVLYELFTGINLWNEMKNPYFNLPPMKQYNIKITDKISNLILNCLEFLPENRFVDLNCIIQELSKNL